MVATRKTAIPNQENWTTSKTVRNWSDEDLQCCAYDQEQWHRQRHDRIRNTEILRHVWEAWQKHIHYHRRHACQNDQCEYMRWGIAIHKAGLGFIFHVKEVCSLLSDVH